MHNNIRPKKFYAILVASFCSFALFVVLYCIEFSTGGGLKNSLSRPWISLFDFFNHQGLNIIASCFSIVLVIFFLTFFVIWFRSTKEKSDKMFLSLFFVLLAITAIYGIRAFDDYNIFTLYKGDIVGILTVVCSLLSIITLSIANAYVTLRTINVVSPISEAGENKDTVYIEPPVPIIPKKSTTDSCTLSKKVLLPKTPQNNIKIEKEPTFDMVLYKALLHLKNEYDLKKAEDSSISQSGYVSNNPSENIGRIRPIVIKINEGKDEKVVYSAEELKKYV